MIFHERCWISYRSPAQQDHDTVLNTENKTSSFLETQACNTDIDHLQAVSHFIATFEEPILKSWLNLTH